MISSHVRAGRARLTLRAFWSGVLPACTALAIGLFPAARPALAANVALFVGGTPSPEPALGYDFGNPANWEIVGQNPPYAPQTGDNALLSMGQTAYYSVTTNGDPSSFTFNHMNIGDDASDGTGISGNGTLYQDSGSLTITGNGWINIGGNQGSSTVGIYNLSGTGSITQTGDTLSVGGGGFGVFNLSGNATSHSTGGGYITIGRWNSGTGLLTQAGNSIVTSVNDVRDGEGGKGTYTMTDSSQLTANNVNLGDNDGNGAGSGIFVQSGSSSVSVTGGNLTIGGGGQGGYTMQGSSTLSVQHQMFVGSSNSGANGTYNQSGGTATISGGVVLGNASGAVGIVNLAAGTLSAASVSQGSGTGTLNFLGGTLKATTSTTTFISGVANAYVYSSGGAIDNGGNNITISQSFSAPTGNGVSASGLTVSGSGFLGIPLVQISGGGGTGATANLTVDSSGNLTGIVITNPGVGYTSSPTFTLLGGGPGATGGISGTAVLVANTQGTLTFQGAGVTTLSASNIYAGPVAVNSGSLDLVNSLALASSTLTSGIQFAPTGSGTNFTLGALTGSGTINLTDTGSNAVTLSTGNLNTNSTFSGGTSGAGTLAKIGTGTLTFTGTSSLNAATQVQNGTLRITGSAGGTGTISVGGNGATGTPTLAGTGTLNSPAVISGPGTGVAGILAPSAGGSSPTTLTFGSSLTLSTGSILSLTLSNSLTSGNDQVVMTGGNVLTLGTSGTVNIAAPSGLSVGNYVLISNTGGTIAGGAGWTASVTGDAGHSYILGPQGTNFDLTVTSGASITWTGHTNGTWDTTTPNWTPNFTGTYTEGDLVTFNDSGNNTTNIHITGTGGNNTVSPAFMTFSNTLDPYTFTSGTIAGTGSVAINNSGTVTFLNTNTFTGGTSVTNGSTLNIGDAGLDSGSYASSVIAVSGTGSNLNVGTLGSLTATAGVSPSLVLGSGGAATFNNTSQTLGSLNGDNTTTLTLNGTALTVGAGGTMDGLIGGAGSLTVAGGTLALTNGGNTFSGGSTISGGGTLTINTDGTATGTNTPLGAIPGSPANNLFINGGTLRVNGTYTLNANRSILLGPSSGTGSGTLAVTGSNVLTVPGTISNNGTSTAALIKSGTGTLILTGTNNNYSGGTVINGGTVQASAQGNLGSATGTVTLNGGVTLVYQGAAGFFPGLTGQYWANQNPSFGGNGNTFGFTNETDSANYFAGLPTPNYNNLVLPTTGNGVQGWNGGINFLNSNGSGANAFAPINVNVGNNNLEARWTGTINLAQQETIIFSANSDDASFVILSNGSGSPGSSPIPSGGEVVVNRDGGHGEGVTTGSTVTLPAGSYNIDVPYTQGGGGWGVAAYYQIGATTYVIGTTDTTDGVSFSSTITSGSGVGPIAISNPITVNGASNTLTINTASPATLGALTFGNGASLTLNGTAPSATFSGTTFNGGAVTLNNTPAVLAGALSNNAGPLTSFTKQGSGSLAINSNNDSAGNFTNAAVNIQAGSISTQAGLTSTGLGSSKFNLQGGNLTITANNTGTAPGLNGSFWPLSPGDNGSSAPYNNGTGGPTPNTQNNNWNDNGGAGNSGSTLLAEISALGPAYVTAYTPPTANLNPSGNNGPNYTYTGGINFGTSITGSGGIGGGTNALAAIGVNISGNGTSPPYTGPAGGYNSITGEWTGTLTASQAGTLNFAINSDDASFVIIDGTIVFDRNGGHGFDGSPQTSTAALTAGTHSIEVLWDEGGGGWGIVGQYSFTPTGGSAGSSFYLGQTDSADGISFTTSGVPNVGFTLSNPVTVSGTTSSLTLNALTGVTFNASPAALTMANGANLTVSGSTPSATFTTTVLSGSSTFTANIPVEAGIVSNGGSPAFSSLTMAGTSQLLLDSTNNTAFVSGTMINANVGTVAGVNVGGVDSLGLATLNVNGGTFSLGSDGHNGSAGDNFANPITLTASGTIIGQQLGAGAVAGSTINLTGGIATGSSAASVLTLNTANGYTLNVASAMTGSGTVNGAGTVNLNVANPGYTGALTVAGGTTTDNALGALATAGSATVNGGNLNIAAAGETVNNLTVNSGGAANVNASGVNLPFATSVNSGGTLRVAGALGTAAPINIAGGGTLNVATTGNLANATVNLGSATNLLQPTTLAVVTGAGSLGSGPVNVNPSAELRLSSGTGASNYTGSTISVNNGLVHVTSGSANLGSAVINVTPQVTGGINGLTGVLYAGLSNGAVLNASGNGGSNILSLMQGAVVGGVSPSNSRILTAASTPHGDGIDFRSDSDMGTYFGNSNVANGCCGGDNYSTVFFGHFTAPTAGSYNFAVTGVDDNAAIYVDTANGTNFTQIASANCCNFSTTQSQGTAGTVSLTAGQVIAVVFAQQDGGGGSSFAAGFELAPAPSNNNNNTYTIVGPGIAAQAGLWSFDTVTGGGTIQVDAGASLVAGGFVTATNVNLANGAALTLSAPSNNFTSSTTQLSVTGTTPTAALTFAGSNNHTVNVGTLSIATGGTLNLTNSGTGAGTLRVTGAGDPANTGSLRVGSGTALSGTGSTSGSVTALSGGAIDGASGGTLTIGSLSAPAALTLSAGSGTALNLTTAGVNNSAPLVAVTGALTVNSASTISLGSNSLIAAGIYDLYSFGSNGNAFTGASFSAPSSYGGLSLAVTVTGAQVDLNVTGSAQMTNFWSSTPASPTTVPTSFGTPVTWSVANGGTYAGIGSSAVGQAGGSPGTGAAFLTEPGGSPLVATILAGTNSGSFTAANPTTVSMSWRARTAYETGPGSASPPLPYVGHGGLISNVLNLTGLGNGGTEPVEADPFVLQMEYNPQAIPGLGNLSGATLANVALPYAQTGAIYLAWLNPTGFQGTSPLWQSVVSGDFGSAGPDSVQNFQGSFAAFLSFENGLHPTLFADDPTLNPANLSSSDLAAILGSSGVDNPNYESGGGSYNTWAVINHNSQFAVVPEPSTLLLAALGLAGVAGYRVRRRRK